MSGFDDEGLSDLPREAAEAAAALEGLKEPARRAAQSIDDAFAKAGASLARSLGRAAADGKISLAELAEAVLAAVNAAGRGGGLGEAVVAALDGGFGGARADGGPVSSGGAYLVGERGPEVFRPVSAGVIEPAASGGMTVNITLQGEGGRTLLRSEAQIAQALARAVSLGARRL